LRPVFEDLRASMLKGTIQSACGHLDDGIPGPGRSRGNASPCARRATAQVFRMSRMVLALTLAAMSTASASTSAAPDPQNGTLVSKSTATINSTSRIIYPADRLPRLRLPDGSHHEVRSLLRIEHPLRYGDYRWNAEGVPSGAVWVRVDLQRQLLSVFRAGHEIGSTVIMYGADTKPTPAGVYPILERAERHRSTLYGASMPYMLRLTADGISIHASQVRRRGATHGCIGVPLPFARRLYAQVRRGDLVAIL